MNGKEVELNKKFVEEKIRENKEDAEMLKRALIDHPEAISFWRESNENIKEAINLTWFCMDEIVKRSERLHLERAEMKEDFVQNMTNGLALLDKAHEDDMDVESAKDRVDKALILFSEAFDIFKKLEGMNKKQEGKS